MMTKPSITELDKSVDSRYTLVAMAAKRARMIGLEREKQIDEPDTSLEKPVSQAVNEIANGVVGYVRSEAIARAREYEEEKIIAISKLEREAAEPEKTENTAEQAQAAEEDGDLFGDDAECNAIDAALKLALEKNADSEAAE